MGATLAVTAAGGVATAQTAASALPRQAGTVAATSATGLTLTTQAGQSVTVTVPPEAKVLVVPPGARDLKSATAGSLSDVATGDKALVTGSAGDTGSTLTATRVILMKASALAQTHAQQEAAWQRGGGGIIKSVDPATGKIEVSSNGKPLTVVVTPQTDIKRYSGDSVAFADAKPSTLAAVQVGDQLRVRGTRSADGSSIAADAIVTGTFRNYSGLLTAVDPAAGTVTLKDLKSKKVVTVTVTPATDVRRLPAMAAMFLARSASGAAPQRSGGEPAGAAAPGGAPGGRPAMPRGPGALTQVFQRAPKQTLAELKPGDAVMIVATAASAGASSSTAVSLLAGVDALLSASPNGDAGDMQLSPWSVGGDAPTGESGGGGAGGPGGAR